ncbi:MAG: TIGR04282 family arsenosugar biosynthesis glycosyltransferase [Nevskiales bacterium]
MRFLQHRILIFTRAPVAGACKTRLIPALGRRGAARAHRQLASHSLRMAQGAALAPVTLCCAPDSRHAFFTLARMRTGVRLQRQSGSDLGRRMAGALRQALRSCRAAIIIGTDCPLLDAEYLAQACAALEQHDVVLGPAADGGYVLVGTCVHEPRLFAGIRWGGPRVLAATRRRLRRLRLDWIELQTLWDVDTARDWSRARRSLKRRPP